MGVHTIDRLAGLSSAQSIAILQCMPWLFIIVGAVFIILGVLFIILGVVFIILDASFIILDVVYLSRRRCNYHSGKIIF